MSRREPVGVTVARAPKRRSQQPPTPPRELTEFPLPVDTDLYDPALVDIWRRWFEARDNWARQHNYEWPDDDNGLAMRIYVEMATGEPMGDTPLFYGRRTAGEGG